MHVYGNAFGVPLDLLLEGGCSALEASYAGEDSCTVLFLCLVTDGG